MRRAFLTTVFSLMALVSSAMVAEAQTSPQSFAGISIRNFGQMTDNLYRGGQPSESDYKALAAFGIKTIVDLRSDHETWAQADAEAAGLKYVLIPMNGVSAPTDDQVAEFLQIANDPSSGKIYFHCKAGIHRTGTMGAVYRINHDGWDYDRAYTEMTNYQFSAGLFHGGLKSFVKRYADSMASQRAAVAVKAPVITEAPATPVVTAPAPVTTTAPSITTAPVLTKVSLTTTDLTTTKAPAAAAQAPVKLKAVVAKRTSRRAKKVLRARTSHIHSSTASLVAAR